MKISGHGVLGPHMRQAHHSKSPKGHNQTIVFTHEETETQEGGAHFDPSNRFNSNMSKGHSPDRLTGVGLHKLESRFFKNQAGGVDEGVQMGGPKQMINQSSGMLDTDNPLLSSTQKFPKMRGRTRGSMGGASGKQPDRQKIELPVVSLNAAGPLDTYNRQKMLFF